MRTLTIVVYLGLGLLLVALEVAARTGLSRSVPTLGAILRHPMRLRASRIGLFVAWWWIGWHFFVG
jgi:hypothetical protein